MNQQVKYMLRTYESFIIHSSFSSFNHHHQTKNHHKQTCNRATLRLFSVKKITVRMKNVKSRGIRGTKKANSAVNSAVPTQNSVLTQNSAGRLEIPGSAETCGPYHHHQERTPLWGMAVQMRPL